MAARNAKAATPVPLTWKQAGLPGPPRLPRRRLTRRQRPRRRRSPWLIKDRIDVIGARWSFDGAESVLKLRALTDNGDFDDYVAFHLKQEKRRNHDSGYRKPQPLAV